MTAFFPILEVTSAMRGSMEPLGSKPKFWFSHNGESWLFKEARINTGEDWAEKVASEIATLLDLPTHHVELAVWEGKYGCAVKSFLSAGSVLVHGNELLGAALADYDKEKQWGQSHHTIDNIVTALEGVFPLPKARREVAFQMIGYLLFDALVGNTDRHHQNWGVVLHRQVKENQPLAFSLQLAPTFDHASSLGRELLDTAREQHLQQNSIRRYLERAKGGIFGDNHSRYGLSPIATARFLAARYPDFFKPWQARISNLSMNELAAIVARIPDQRISMAGRNFAMTLLSESQKLITEIL